MSDIFVKLIDFGVSSSDGFVRHNDDDSYTICLNARQAANRIRDAYEHELAHIQRNDLENRSDKDVSTIERENE